MGLFGKPRAYLRFGRGIFRVIIPVNTPKPATYWTHPGCGVHHKRPDTAAHCAAGSRGPLTRHN